jgi:hypothetical protein
MIDIAARRTGEDADFVACRKSDKRLGEWVVGQFEFRLGMPVLFYLDSHPPQDIAR